MGKKSTPKVPEPYELEELLKYNTDLNRFNSVNPFGSQTWSQDGDQWTMTQAISPELQGVYDQQLAFINQGNTPRETPGPMQDMQQALMDKRAALSGATPGYHPDVPPTSAPRPVVPEAPEEALPPEQQGPPAPVDGSVTDLPPRGGSAGGRYNERMRPHSIKGNEWNAAGDALAQVLKNRRQ